MTQHSIRSMVYRVVGTALAGLVIVTAISIYYGLQLRQSASQMRAVSLKASRLLYTISQDLHAQGAIANAAPGIMEVASIKNDAATFLQLSTNIDLTFKQLAPLVSDADLNKSIQALQTDLPAFRLAASNVLELASTFQQAPALEALQNQFTPTAKRVSQSSDKLMQRALDLIDQRPAEILSLTTTSNRTSLIAGTGILLLAAAYTLLTVRRGIIQPLQGMTASLQTAADHSARAADQIAAASHSLAERASQQAASLEETSASLEEISSMTQRNAESAQTASSLASEARKAADSGAHDIDAMKSAMADIRSSSNSIAKIIRTIDEIAFQTNILALNAAVEAARAGEAGAGFAVVADEVRSLAQRSATAARETASSIEDSIAKSERGNTISTKVASSLTEILNKTRQLDQLVAEIAAASREQSQGIAQVNTAVSDMDKSTQANAATAEESASAAEELNSQSASLHRAVHQLQHLVDGSSQPNPAPAHVPNSSASNPQSEPEPSPVAAAPAPKSSPPARTSSISQGSDFKDF